MPELPDITVYVEKIAERIVGQPIEEVRIPAFFFLRAIDAAPPLLKGKRVRAVSRLGKRVVIELEDELFLVIHLMIAGRFLWKNKGAKIPATIGLAAFDFPNGSLIVTEAGSKKRASLHIIRGREKLEAMNPGGLEIFEASFEEFRNRLISENHTLKRALTDPRLFSGIGNSYSDEILHRAKLSPVLLTQKQGDETIKILFDAIRKVMTEWTERLRDEAGKEFPENVTAFRKEMAVHGRFGKPCPVCGTAVQRIRYEENETNYCPVCQTGGKLLADRALSRLLKSDWPKTVEELEERKLATETQRAQSKNQK